MLSSDQAFDNSLSENEAPRCAPHFEYDSSPSEFSNDDNRDQYGSDASIGVGNDLGLVRDAGVVPPQW